MRGAEILAITVGLGASLALGCRAPAVSAEPTRMTVRIADRERFFDDTLTLLREYDLPPERVDRGAGTIVSERTTSAQWFEPWRVDTPGGYQTLESSLHTIGRVVTLSLAPRDATADPAEYDLTVQVDKARYNAPSRQVTSASAALAIYSERLPTSEGLRAAKATGASWTPLGRDGELEALLLGRIIARTGVEP